MGLDLNININELFDKIRSKASTVAINISSRSYMEIMEIDKDGKINNYAQVPIQYNAITKELENVADFQSSIKRTFSEMGLSFSSKVYLSIPTYVIDRQDLPRVDDDEAVKTMLMSSVESNYIFRKYDPAISFYKLSDDVTPDGSLSVCYTALRADEYSKIVNVFEELGIRIVAVDASYSALINGVIATNKIDPAVIERQGSWNIVNITSNSYLIFAMKGRDLVAVYEEPIAVKSFSEEEIYQVITASLDNILGNYPSDYMIFVSQSDNVSAEYLSEVVNTNATKAYLDDNKYRRQLVELGYNITQSNKTKISIEAIGISVYPTLKTGIVFNFLDAPIEIENVTESIIVNIGGQEVELTPEKIQKICLCIGVLLAIILGLAYWGLDTLDNINNKKVMAYTDKINEIQKELDIKPQETGISEEEFLQKHYGYNLDYKKSYAALGREIPDMLWIEEFQLAEDSKMFLQGRSYRMDDVLNYYDSLSKIGKFPNLKITTLKISNEPISELLLTKNSTMTEETTYEFSFGQKIYSEPVTVTPAENGNKDGNTTNDAAPPPPITPTETAPPPTNIPKQDS